MLLVSASFWVTTCSLLAVSFCLQEAADCPADSGLQNHGVVLLQTRKITSIACPNSPQLGGTSVDALIKDTKGVLVLAIQNMKCAEAVKTALNIKGIPFETKTFTGPFQYSAGISEVWDYLHCTYPGDKSGGVIMHSYVFLNGKFLGHGFDAAGKISKGELDNEVDVKAGKSCEKQFPDEAVIAQQYMKNSSNRVLLFGWLACPCVGIAQQRLSAKNACYEGRQWGDPNSKLMAYFQCKEKDPNSHSFVYFRSGSGWSYAGNGFQLAADKMSEKQLNSKLIAANAKTTCKHANVKVNVFGTQLEECQVGGDTSGSWMDDGTCSEQTGGVHQICVEALPADFSSETHQDPWSQARKGKRHCVCVGAWSLYMTDAQKHVAGAKNIMPHCSAIPETTLTTRYLAHWRDWNGYPAHVLTGVKELVNRCLKQASSLKLKCGLKQRFEKLRGSPEAKELHNAKELEDLVKLFSSMACPNSAALLQSESLSKADCV